MRVAKLLEYPIYGLQFCEGRRRGRRPVMPVTNVGLTLTSSAALILGARQASELRLRKRGWWPKCHQDFILHEQYPLSDHRKEGASRQAAIASARRADHQCP